MKQAAIQKAFETFLQERSLKLTPQRLRVFERAYDTHEHFSAETFYEWMKAEEGSTVSRATVYRTIGLLTEGGFLSELDTGKGEMLYEHVLGHRHHDHLVCTECGRIEEFCDDQIEERQQLVAKKHGFELSSHSMRLFGVCKGCRRGK